MAHSFVFSGPIDTPPRSSSAGAAIVISVVAVLSLAMVLPDATGKWALAALALLLPLAIVCKAIYAVHIALLALVWISLVGFVPFFRLWPLNILAPLAVYGGAVMLSPPLRQSVGWLRAGRSGRDVRMLILATVVVSGVALVAWTALTKPDLEHHLALVPALPLWAYPLVAVAFAVVNAAMEEAVFRGVMMEALDSALGDGYWSTGTQAVSFAALHYLTGFPSGVLGFFMVLVYGVMLGVIRRRSSGLLAPWIAHVMADIAIFSILAVMLFQGGSGPFLR
jgi:membrane protease YdiL (CAAX protease family)